MENYDISKQEKIVFRSRYSILLIFIYSVLIFFLIKEHHRLPLLELFVISFAFILLGLTFAGIRYIVEGDKLKFQIWSVKNGEIKINSIVGIERTYIPISSRAASLKRLGCSLKKGGKWPFILISPINEMKFIQALQKVNPDIKVDIKDANGKFRILDWDI